MTSGLVTGTHRRHFEVELPDGEVLLCGEGAAEERTVEGLVMPLCADHARELDEERAAAEAELAAIASDARAAGFLGHLPEGDLSEWCRELEAAELPEFAARVRATETYRNS